MTSTLSQTDPFPGDTPQDRRLAALLALEEAQKKRDPVQEMLTLDAFPDLQKELARVRAIEGRMKRLVKRPSYLDEVPTLGSIAAYDLLHKIAEGTFGVVYKARHRLLGRLVAIKVFRGNLDQVSALTRFYEEAQVASQIEHPGIAPIHELGHLPPQPGQRLGAPYVVMQFVPEGTFADLLDRERPWVNPKNLPACLQVFLRICETVAHAHRKGVLHRDLKPGNVMIGSFGQVFVMDWGLVKVLASPAESPSGSPAELEPLETLRTRNDVQTEAGTRIGTLLYMSPEQLLGRPNDYRFRPDVFGLGAILCEILTGQPPWGNVHEDREDVLQRTELLNLEPAFERLRQLRGQGIDPALIDLTLQCLAYQPHDRPAHAGVVAQRVAGYLDGVQEKLRTRSLKLARAGLMLALLLALVFAGVAWAIGTQLAWQRDIQHRERAEVQRRESSRQEAAEHGLAEGLAALRADQITRAATALGRVEGLVQEGFAAGLQTRAESQRRAVTFVQQRERLRLQRSLVPDGEEFDPGDSDLRLKQLLLAYGLDFDNVPAAAENIRTSPVRDHLLAALDQLALIERYPPTRRLVLQLAQTASELSLEREMRDPQAPKDPAQLARRLQQAPVEQLSPVQVESLVCALRRLKDNPEPVLRRALQFHRGDYALNVLLAQTLLARRQPDAALGFAQVASALRPESGFALEMLGRVFTELGRYPEADQALNQARIAEPKLAIVALSLARLRLKQGNHEAAREYLREAELLGANPARVAKLRAEIPPVQ